MKNWIKRALRTFIQSAVGYIVVALPTIDFFGDGELLKMTLVGVGISAVSAGLAAVMNIIDEKKLNGGV